MDLRTLRSDGRDTEGPMNSFPMFAKCYEHQATWFDDDVARTGRASASKVQRWSFIWPIWSVAYLKTPLLAIKED